MLSGNILSWTVCVESSCFLTPVGGSLPLPVLLCFCSPSVSVVVSWHLYSSEGWGRAEKRGEHSPADLCDGTPIQQQCKMLAKLFMPGTQLEKFSSWHEPQIITAYVHACHVKALWICSRSRKQFRSEPKFFYFFLNFCQLASSLLSCQSQSSSIPWFQVPTA